MYKCLECGGTFETPQRISEDCTPGYGCEASFINYFEVCPFCQGDFGEAKECRECGIEFAKEELKEYEGKYYCEECYRIKEAEENY